MADLAAQGDMPAILAIEELIKQMPQGDYITRHYHLDGVYVRSLFMPAGSLLTGKIHNKESIGILAQGTLRVTNGTHAAVIHAPYIMVDKPGVKRLGYAETDCTFITVHRTDAVGIENIEAELVSDTFEEYAQKKLIESQNEQIEVFT
jgi:hypothetical protein